VFITSALSLYRFHMCISLIPRILIMLVVLISMSGCSITRALRVEDGTSVDVRTMIDEVSDVPVVFVGERHDAAEHHKLQLEVLKGLKEKGKSLAIGMEMFEVFSQKALDAWSAGKIPTYAFIKVYQSNWRNVPYWLYEDIFNYARDNHIPIVALNAPREIVTKVSQQGISSLTNDDRSSLPLGVDSEVSDAYLELIRSSYSVHNRNSEHFRHICEAQMLRNRVMASRIRDYNQLHPERVVMVLTGGGHAREKGGIPAELGGLPFRIILPPVPGLDAESIRKEDTNFLLEEPFSLF
jgi:uncharacterized iron-regulated protein